MKVSMGKSVTFQNISDKKVKVWVSSLIWMASCTSGLTHLILYNSKDLILYNSKEFGFAEFGIADVKLQLLENIFRQMIMHHLIKIEKQIYVIDIY